jgi:hypothetical protein
MEQYELNWKDYYGALGVHMSAEPEVIKGAYNAMARKYHPDTGGSTQRMKEINESYEVLSDPQRKASYDLYCRQRQASSAAGRGARTQDSSGSSDAQKGTQSGQQPGSSSERSRPYRRPASGNARTSSTGTGQSRRTKKSTGSQPAPNPLYEDADHKLMSWPSHRWQQAGLVGAVLIGTAMVFMAPILWLKLVAIVLAAMGLYACIKTRFATQVKRAHKLARISGIISVSVALFLMGLTAAALAAGVFAAAMTIKATTSIGKALIKAR